MSVDTADFAAQTMRLKQGLQPGFFPIVIDATKYSIGQEVEVTINPCDHIWLPVFFDPSLGLNPAQTLGLNQNSFWGGPNYNRVPGPGAGGQVVGMNIFDIWSIVAVTGYRQAAPIFSLRFNSVNAPWTL